MRDPLIWRAIAGFRLVCADPERLVRFYAALGFSPDTPFAIAAAEMAMLGLRGAGRRWPLRLGETVLELDAYEDAGRSYPGDTDASWRGFQHLALATRDAAADWRRVREVGAASISHDGPVTLPASSGGVTAVKFRDPEGHPLELLQVPGGGAPGIDHSAISVADVGGSRSFYEDHGLSVGHVTLNHGPAQDALDGLSHAVVDVAPLLPAEPTPHLELLGYRRARGAAVPPPAVNDVAATRVVWRGGEPGLVRDPDGHLHQLGG